MCYDSVKLSTDFSHPKTVVSTQPPTDRQAAAGRAEGQVARELAHHQAGAAKLLFRIIALPFWLPFYLVGVIKQRRGMAEFVREQSEGRVADDALGREIALAWVAQHSERYPHGQYDRRFDKLERRFARMSRQYREDNR